MRRYALFLSLLSGVSGLALLPGPAAAGGPPAVSPALPQLQKQVAAARAQMPAAFASVEAVRQRVQSNPPSRERQTQVAMELKALGPGALLPMLSLLAFEQDKLREGPAAAQRTLTVALLEAVGELRDPRAAPVLRQVLDGPEGDELVARTAAAGIGMLCRDEDVTYLAALAGPGQRREGAALTGLGRCRRLPAAAQLVARLGARPGPATAIVTAQALGFLGSSWAWAALDHSGPAGQPAQSGAGDGDAIRGEAARALVGAFAAYQGEARAAIGRAILMVDHPSTVALLGQARAGADPALAAAIDELQQRLARGR